MGLASISDSARTKDESIVESCPMPAAEENVKVEADNDTGDGASAVLIAWAIDFSFFLVGGRA